MKSVTTRFSGWLVSPFAVLLWGGVVAIGMLSLVRYQMTPGSQALAAPEVWPATVKDVAPAGDRFTLVMMLHPRCPCSRASVGELAQLMAPANGRLNAHVLFVKPPGAPADWCDGDLWKLAKDIPGVQVSIDDKAADAAIFGATTSGQVMVYDAAGVMRFSGGITDGRGHEGDNTGLSTILELVRGGKAVVSSTPVYGCPLGTCPRKQSE